MKKLNLGLALGLWMAMGTASLYAVGMFEGEVDYNVTAKQHDITTEYFMKGKQIRANTMINGRESDVIIDMESRQFTMIMTAQKMYTTMAIPESNSSAISKGTFTDTGTKYTPGDTRK